MVYYIYHIVCNFDSSKLNFVVLHEILHCRKLSYTWFVLGGIYKAGKTVFLCNPIFSIYSPLMLLSITDFREVIETNNKSINLQPFLIPI